MLKVSVIIPTYGKPIFLNDAIISVLNQTLKNIELIIVDDNNPDTEVRQLTEKIVQKHTSLDQRITYIKHNKNKNGAVARNTGIAVAKGSYISFLDSDDQYLNDRLQKCYDIAESSNESIAGVYTGCEFRRNGKRYKVHKEVFDGKFIKETLACTFMFSTGSNIFVRRNIIEELNGFDEKFLRHQDYEFLVRLFQKYSLKAITEVLVIKNNENFNLPNVQKMISIKKQYLSKFKYVIQGLSQKEQNYIYKHNYISIAEQALKIKQYELAKEYYTKVKEFGPLSFKSKSRKCLIHLLNYIKLNEKFLL
ncbi:glycosyltransferase family 2 protein [Polaribacter sp. P097]|uniref:glycosyltransferase family 2 protein n=1 Tax=Polaribacter sp. P097 TaxID=3117398 RepID=UPI002FE1BF37